MDCSFGVRQLVAAFKALTSQRTAPKFRTLTAVVFGVRQLAAAFKALTSQRTAKSRALAAVVFGVRQLVAAFKALTSQRTAKFRALAAVVFEAMNKEINRDPEFCRAEEPRRQAITAA